MSIKWLMYFIAVYYYSVMPYCQTMVQAFSVFQTFTQITKRDQQRYETGFY